jgi:pimeloyl-ACP methyl ester carboxylesterase
MTKKRPHADDLRAANRLVIDATTGVMGVVEKMHASIARGPAMLGRPLQRPAGALTGLVYGSLKGVTRAVGFTIDALLAQLAPLLGQSEPGPERMAVVAALNGVLGDFLALTGNALATPMTLCRGGVPLELTREALAEALPGASQKLLLLVHGSSMTDLQWARGGEGWGALLEASAGFTAVYLRYNSGLHVSTNGAQLAQLLEQLAALWPVHLESITLLTHSMGGLVARSACKAAEVQGLRWRQKLEALVFLGTPHHGAPLERGGHLLGDRLLGLHPYSAPLVALGKIRSAGVTDLRHGNVLDADWEGQDRFAHVGDRRTALPLPQGVACYAVAATLSEKAGKKPRSDGLVPVDSALGRSDRWGLSLDFPKERQLVVFGTGHLELLSRPEVGAALERWLAPARA